MSLSALSEDTLHTLYFQMAKEKHRNYLFLKRSILNFRQIFTMLVGGLHSCHVRVVSVRVQWSSTSNIVSESFHQHAVGAAFSARYASWWTTRFIVIIFTVRRDWMLPVIFWLTLLPGATRIVITFWQIYLMFLILGITQVILLYNLKYDIIFLTIFS